MMSIPRVCYLQELKQQAMGMIAEDGLEVRNRQGASRDAVMEKHLVDFCSKNFILTAWPPKVT